MVNNDGIISTKQKIVICAVNMFALKGFTETSVREIASEVGIKAASIYSHFRTKNSMLEFILNDYIDFCKSTFFEEDVFLKLKNNPTPQGIMDSLTLSFPDDKKEYYLKTLSVILQEQHRNFVIRSFVTKEIILKDEENIKTIINILKSLNVIRLDTNSDFWAKMGGSLFYAFSNRMLLGIGDMSPGFKGISMADALKNLFELMFETCGV